MKTNYNLLSIEAKKSVKELLCLMEFTTGYALKNSICVVSLEHGDLEKILESGILPKIILSCVLEKPELIDYCTKKDVMIIHGFSTKLYYKLITETPLYNNIIYDQFVQYVNNDILY